MPQHLRGHRLISSRRDIVTSPEASSCPGAAIQREGCARAGASQRSRQRDDGHKARDRGGHHQMQQVVLDIGT